MFTTHLLSLLGSTVLCDPCGFLGARSRIERLPGSDGNPSPRCVAVSICLHKLHGRAYEPALPAAVSGYLKPALRSCIIILQLCVAASQIHTPRSHQPHLHMMFK